MQYQKLTFKPQTIYRRFRHQRHLMTVFSNVLYQRIDRVQTEEIMSLLAATFSFKVISKNFFQSNKPYFYN